MILDFGGTVKTKERFYFTISAPSVLAGLTLLCVGIGAAYYVDRLNRNVSELVEVHVRSERASGELLLNIRDIRVRLHQFLARRDWTLLERVAAKRTQTSGMIESVASRSPSIEDPNSAVEAHNRFFDRLEKLVNTRSNAEPDDLLPLLDDLTQGLLSEVESLHRVNQDALKEVSRRNLSIAHGLVWGLLALGVCGGAAGMVSGFRIASRTIDLVEQSEREAARSEQLAGVGQIAAGLAHELHNPLMTMQVLTQGATEHGSNGRLEGRDLEILEEEIRRLTELVQSFLDFARPPDSNPVEFDFSDLIRRTVSLIVGRAARQNVVVETQLPDESLIVKADPAQLRQVALNLLLNAIESQPSGGRVIIRANLVAYLEGRSPESKHLELCVQDAGTGIPEDQADLIFEPFVSFKDSGMGLGLSVCRRIVEAHGGTITTEAGVESGSRFTVTVPVG